MGTLMRQAVCAFGFDEPGAAQMTSAYLDENQRSAGVSRKVGYQFNGRVRMVHPDGERVRVEEKVVLLPENFTRPPHPVRVDGADAFRTFIGL
ncbi:GNAT family protein [Luteococcus japonicus]